MDSDTKVPLTKMRDESTRIVGDKKICGLTLVTVCPPPGMRLIRVDKKESLDHDGADVDRQVASDSPKEQEEE